jgi:hypothetical protein
VATVLEPLEAGADPLDDPDDVAADSGDTVAELEPIPVGRGVGEVVVRVPVAGRDPTAGALEFDGGVYPVLIDFRPTPPGGQTDQAANRDGTEDDDGDDASGGSGPERLRLVTHMIVLPREAVQPRPIAVVLDLRASLTWRAGAVAVDDVDSLAATVALVDTFPDLPVTVRLTPGLAAALDGPSTSAEFAADLRALARSPATQLIHGPFADVPAGAWTTPTLNLKLIEQFDQGIAALTELRGQGIDGSSWMVGATDDAATLRWLAARGVRFMVVGDDRLAVAAGGGDGEPDRSDAPSERDPRAPFDLGYGAIGFPVQRLDPRGGEQAVHRFLAGAAVGVVDADDRDPPNTSDGANASGIAGRPAPFTVTAETATSEGRAQLTTLLRALSRPGGPVTAGRLSDVGAGLDPRNLPERDLTPPATLELGATAADLDAIEFDIASYIATAGDDDPRPDGWRQMWLVAAGGTSAQRRALVDQVRAETIATLSTIELPATELITVTALRADLPVSLRNTGARRIRLALEFSSEDLVIEDAPREVELEPGETVDLALPVRLNRSGEFELNLRLLTADRRIVLAEDALRVRSTAVPGAGVAVSVAALAFLALWWVRHLRRERRRNSTPPQAPPEPASAPTAVEEPVP